MKGVRGNACPLLALLLAFAALAGVYSVVTPVFEGPDEIWHFAFASHLADGSGLPVLSAEQPNLLLRNAAHPPLYYLPVAGLIAPIDRQDFPTEFRFNLASPHITPGSISDRPNLLIHTRHEDWPWRQSVLAVHLGRLVSIALSAITLWGVWEGARRLLPGSASLPLLVVALAASLPQYVYGAAVINNDALAAAAGAWCLVALIELMNTLSLRWAALAGLVLGIGLLSKIGMVALLPLPAAALAISHLLAQPVAGRSGRERIWRSVLAGLFVHSVAALVAGWWYTRNWLLYGDPLAWREWQALAGVGRSGVTAAQFSADLLGLFGTFWADFGLRADRGWVWAFAALALVALGGLAARWRRRDWPALHKGGLVLAVLWLCMLLASALRYALVITDIHGRLLYPALTAAAVVLALGLTGWGPRIGRWLALGTTVGLLTLTAIVPFALLRPAFARPTAAAGALPDSAAATGAAFGDAVALAGYRLGDTRLQPPGTVVVTTYWRPAAGPRPLPDTRAVLALIRPDGQVVARYEALLGSSVYPSSVWQEGDLIVLDSAIAVGALLDGPVVADLVLGVRADSDALLPGTQGDTISLGRVALGTGEPCAMAANAGQIFGDEIRLIGYQIDPDGVTLCWEALRPLDTDYTVFIHALHSAGGVTIGDGPPRQGLYPTSAWLTGEQVEDYHALSVPDGTRIEIGLYRLADGQRLPLAGSEETVLELVP